MMVCKNSKKCFAKKSLNVPNVKQLSKKFSNVFSLFMHFCWVWHLALCTLSDFPGIRNLSGLNDLNNLNSLNNLNGLHSLILPLDLQMFSNFIHPSTKMTCTGVSIWDASSKTYYFYCSLSISLLEAVEAILLLTKSKGQKWNARSQWTYIYLFHSLKFHISISQS